MDENYRYLLNPEEIERLSESETIAIFIERLHETPYGTITFDDLGDPSIALEKEFYLKFIERMTKIVDIAPKKWVNSSKHIIIFGLRF